MLLYESLIVSIDTSSATQTLPKLCVALRPGVAAFYQPGGATAVDFQELTPTESAPAAGEIQFTGSAIAPSDQVTLAAAPPAGSFLLVWAAPVGALPTYP